MVNFIESIEPLLCIVHQARGAGYTSDITFTHIHTSCKKLVLQIKLFFFFFNKITSIVIKSDYLNETPYNVNVVTGHIARANGSSTKTGVS